MAQYRWYDVLNEITKAERKYNIRNPNWDNGFPGVFRDYGFAPVDTKGEWWTRIPDAPELPIIYGVPTTTSYTVPTGIGTSTTTGLIDTVNVIGDATFEEISTGGTAATVTTAGVATSVSSAVGTAAVGAAIGFGVGVASFEAAPEFWTKVSNAVFGTDLDPAEIGQMTRDTNALVVIKDGIVYMAQDMVEAIRNAFFDNGAADSGFKYPSASGESIRVNVIASGNINSMITTALDGELDIANLTGTDLEYFSHMLQATGECNVSLLYSASTKTYILTAYLWEDGTLSLPYDTTILTTDSGIKYINMPTSYTAKTSYSATLQIYYSAELGKYRVTPLIPVVKKNNRGDKYYQQRWVGYQQIGDNFYIGSINTVYSNVVDGITPDGTQGTKDQPLSVVFPDWVSKAIETVAGDGKTKVKWLPVSIPNTDPLISGNPITGDKAREGTLPDNYTKTANQLGEQAQEKTKNAPSYPTPPITPVPDVTPTPTPPSISGGGGSTTGLANLYNPTLAQVKQFSRWLWGSDGLNLDQLKKLLQDPMQAIIGLHVMYATPTTGADRDIQVGYINSGVQSKIVTEQYTEIDCGTVTINEYFGDARDYSPFTQVYCYLPFIGIVELNADDVVNSTLGIKYKIDVLTGCCLAQLTVKKYGLDAVLYTYTGNCAVQMPITSGNYLSTVSSLLGAVVSGATAVATGGALAPVAIGAAANALGGGARASVAMSGSLGSNAGAMGIRKPYLIIKRVESADANGYNEFYGYPTNKRVNLSQLTGYVRVKDINLSGTNATEDEQNEIVTLLKEGVIL